MIEDVGLDLGQEWEARRSVQLGRGGPTTALEQDSVSRTQGDQPVYLGQGNGDPVLGDFKELESREISGRSCSTASKS